MTKVHCFDQKEVGEEELPGGFDPEEFWHVATLTEIERAIFRAQGMAHALWHSIRAWGVDPHQIPVVEHMTGPQQYYAFCRHGHPTQFDTILVWTSGEGSSNDTIRIYCRQHDKPWKPNGACWWEFICAFLSALAMVNAWEEVSEPA